MQPDSDEDVDYQDMAGELTDAFAGQDATALAALTPEERGAQLRARQALYD